MPNMRHGTTNGVEYHEVMVPVQAVGGVRARARQAMRAEVARVVQELVLARGYEETTVDDICAAAEISRSTFFRYFPTKEDALLGETLDAGERLRDALAAQPPGEPWAAMRRALDVLIDEYEGHDERTRRLTRIVLSTPSLAARHREKNARWQELLRPEIARRLGADADDAADPRANAVIGAALACVEAALTAWSAGARPQPLSAILDRAMSAPR